MNDLHDALAASWLAYRPRTRDTHLFVERVFEIANTLAILAYNSERQILAFRGTDPCPRDWRDDLNIRLVPCRSGIGRVHAGFQQALDRLWPALKRLPPDPNRLICGHSLGGALAVLAGARWGAGRLITFGAPRTGDRQHAAGYPPAIAATRVVTAGDPVAWLPPACFGFRHAHRCTLLEANGLQPRPGWLAWLRVAPPTETAHELSTYRRFLEKLGPR